MSSVPDGSLSPGGGLIGFGVECVGPDGRSWSNCGHGGLEQGLQLGLDERLPSELLGGSLLTLVAVFDFFDFLCTAVQVIFLTFFSLFIVICYLIKSMSVLGYKLKISMVALASNMYHLRREQFHEAPLIEYT